MKNIQLIIIIANIMDLNKGSNRFLVKLSYKDLVTYFLKDKMRRNIIIRKVYKIN